MKTVIYKYAFVAVDVFSKKIFAVPIKNKQPAESVRAFTEILEKIGIPEQIYHDNEGAWSSNEFIRLLNKNNKGLKTNKVELILYRLDVLKETNENSTNLDWELISFHAIPAGIDTLPMGPVTMMRNQLKLPGGTKGVYSSDKWVESVNFWQKYAIKE